MIFVKTFKGYEDKTAVLDTLVNEWIAAANVDVVDVKSVLAHEPGGRAGSGDFLLTVIYKADASIS